MQWFGAWMTAGLMAIGLGLGSGLWTSALAEEPNEPPATGLQAAAYDVIIIPRAGNGSPRVLTERGWRSLGQRSPRARAYSPRQAGLFRDRQTWARPYSNRTFPYPPSGSRSYRYEDGGPASRAPRWTGFGAYRRLNMQRLY